MTTLYRIRVQGTADSLAYKLKTLGHFSLANTIRHHVEPTVLLDSNNSDMLAHAADLLGIGLDVTKVNVALRHEDGPRD